MSFRVGRALWPIALVSSVTVLQVGAQAGSEAFKREEAPKLIIQECKMSGGIPECAEKETKVTLDANWRWIHNREDWKNCYDGDAWISEYCPEDEAGAKTCAETCAVEGVDKGQYKNTYGIEEIPNGLSMHFVNEHEHGTSVGGRVYVLDGDDKYYMWKLRNREFTFTADISEIECGMNGAVYFVEMDERGDYGKGANEAGAKFGTGYCDAQCPHDIKFIKGEANSYNWKSNPKDFSGNMGHGHWGACCQEMDIWEANAHGQAYTPHPCKDAPNGGNSMVGVYRCEGTDCGDNEKGERYKGVCDKDGCDFNAWRMGDKTFYGKGSKFTIDTSKPMTLVTQFHTHDGTDDGELTEIRRIWVQDGKVVHNAISKNFDPYPESNTITEQMCEDAATAYGGNNHFRHLGGLKEMGDSIARGHVLAISLWDDIEVAMMWLDSDFPRDKDPSTPGVSRGPCPGGEQSLPKYVRKNFPDATHRYTDFKIGEIGSTTTGVGKGDPAPTTLYNDITVRKKDTGGGNEPTRRRRTSSSSARRRRRRRRRREKQPTTTDRRRRRRRRRRRTSTGRRRRRTSTGSRRRRRRTPAPTPAPTPTPTPTPSDGGGESGDTGWSPKKLSEDLGFAKTTRYWDCCKPSCAWPGKALVSSPVKVCKKDGVTKEGENSKNICGGGGVGGPSYMCTDQKAWYDPVRKMSFGFVAGHVKGLDEGATCCACYKLIFEKESLPPMIVQLTNTGSDLGDNHFDIQTPGGGFGIFDGCTKQFSVSESAWGKRYGGIMAAGLGKDGCDKLTPEMRDSCRWQFDYLGDNPRIKSHFRVACPAELTDKSGCKREDDDGKEREVPKPRPGCTGPGEDCRDTKCCYDPYQKCYEKDQHWGSCKSSCTPGIDPNDPPQFQDPWTCKLLDNGR